MNKKLQDIKQSLSYGKLFTGKLEKLIYCNLGVMSVLSVLMVAVTILVLCLGQYTIIEISMCIFWCVFSLIVFVITLVMVVHNKKHKKQILLWIEDAIETSAIVKGLPRKKFSLAPYQVAIEFFYNNQYVKKISNAGSLFTGYHIRYDIIGSKVAILYSPKYNEVMILKDKY